MKVKSNLLRIIAFVLAIIIVISNFSSVFASAVTTADLQKSLQKYFNTKIIIKGSDSTTSTHSAMGNSVSISDSIVKLINENKEYQLFDYSIENSKVTFNTDFTTQYTLFDKDVSKLSKDEKISYAFVLYMLFLEDVELSFLSTANTLNVDNSLAYTYLSQNILEKLNDVSDSESNLKSVSKQTDIVSLAVNCENNLLTTGTLTIDLDKFEKLSNSDINAKGTTYKVYLGTLPESEKTNISEYKDWPEIKSSYKYTGKAIKPSINLGGLEEGTDYKVEYYNNKKIGKATIKVTGIGACYKGSFTKTFKIVPAGTSISKVSKTTKTITVNWKKQKTQTTGYQIQYSTNKNFTTGNKKITIKSYKTTSKKITGLKENKDYYVRVRTYKTVNGTKYYSSWSKAKKVRTKSSKENIVKNTVINYLKKAYGKNVVKRVTFNSVKVYNNSEIKKDEALKSYKLGSKDIVFDVEYNIKVPSNCSNKKKMELTAASGEIKGNWIKNKGNCGVIKYKSGKYSVKSFDSGF